MSSELNDAERHENVKERLNTLLHKKILDQHDRLNDVPNKCNESTEEKSKNAELLYQQGENSSEPIVEITENYDDEMTSVSDDDFNQYLLHHVLNEKKKALLRNKDVMNFLQNKLKFNQ